MRSSQFRIRNRKSLVVGLAVAVVLLLIFFSIKNRIWQPVSMSDINPPSPTTITTSQLSSTKPGELINTGDTPECLLGRCPKYLDEPWYAYGEGVGASVVIVPTAMTKGAGEVWIIRFGKVVYKTPQLPEINAWLNGQDLYLSYTAEFTPDMTASSKTETDKLVYKDGAYQLVKVSTNLLGLLLSTLHAEDRTYSPSNHW